VTQGKTSVRVHRLAALAALLVAAGCGTTRSFFGGELAAAIYTAPALNQNSPVQLELLVIYDDQLLQQVTSLTAQQWFAQREQILRDHAAKKSLVSRYWELVPGQPAIEERVSFDVGARAAVVFANYASAGAHRLRMDPHQDVVIHLGDSDVSSSPAAN
jgi:type VI secretion system protein